MNINKIIENLDKGIDMPRMLEDIEAVLIMKAMEITDGSCTKAAELLKVQRTTLVEKRRRLGMPLQLKRKR